MREISLSVLPVFQKMLQQLPKIAEDVPIMIFKNYRRCSDDFCRLLKITKQHRNTKRDSRFKHKNEHAISLDLLVRHEKLSWRETRIMRESWQVLYISLGTKESQNPGTSGNYYKILLGFNINKLASSFIVFVEIPYCATQQ